jgi:VanZ family protein
MYLKRVTSLAASSRFWASGFTFWAVALFVLSSFSITTPEGGPEIPHLDKIIHFGYFLGGGVALTTWILLVKGRGNTAAVRYILPFVVFFIIGALDEYHQTFTPGRSGNDPFDWLADVLGASTGIALANRFHLRLLAFS